MTYADAYVELNRAVEQLTSRGLFVAARWAAEQLSGLDEATQHQGMCLIQKGGSYEQPQQSDEGMLNPRFILATSYFGFKVRHTVPMGRDTPTWNPNNRLPI